MRSDPGGLSVTEQRRMPPGVAARLRAFTALDNPTRVQAFMIIHDHPGISFNELARRLHVATGNLAYHVAFLRGGDLVEMAYVRRSRETTEYRLSDFGKRFYKEIFERALPVSKRKRTGSPEGAAKSRQRTPA